MRKIEIRKLEIDFDREILKINGNDVKDKPVIVALPSDDGWSIRKVFNHTLAKGKTEKCDRITVTLEQS